MCNAARGYDGEAAGEGMMEDVLMKQKVG
jgi:hypothetical protein